MPFWGVVVMVAVFLLIAAAFFVVPRLFSRSPNKRVATLTSPEMPAPSAPAVAKTEPPPAPLTPVTPEPTTPAPATPRAVMPPPSVAAPLAKAPSAPPPVPATTPALENTSVSTATIPPLVENKEENSAVKKQVLARIDAMPHLSPTNRTKLYTAVDHARGMYKLAIISFESGRIAPTPAAVAQLTDGLHTPDAQRLLSDPTAVIIVLGYADSKGDDKRNLQISIDRADGLLGALRDQGKILNVMHAVGMGSSEMFGKGQRDKNRVVEIWAVLP